MIENYFNQIQNLLAQYRHIIENQTLSTKTYTDTSGFVMGELRFIDESSLDFIEVVDVAKPHKGKYKYHYMDRDKAMAFRYDNAPHHKNLNTFPHHKHTQDAILESEEPDLQDVLREIEQSVLKK